MNQTLTEVMRVAVVALGGLSLGISFPVTKLFSHRARRLEALAVRLFFVVHVLVVIFVAGVMAERHGEPMSWYTPMAAAIFTLKAAVLLMIREALLYRESYDTPPTRRAEDPTVPPPGPRNTP
jgi:hypothetical protein